MSQGFPPDIPNWPSLGLKEKELDHPSQLVLLPHPFVGLGVPIVPPGRLPAGTRPATVRCDHRNRAIGLTPNLWTHRTVDWGKRSVR